MKAHKNINLRRKLDRKNGILIIDIMAENPGKFNDVMKELRQKFSDLIRTMKFYGVLEEYK